MVGGGGVGVSLFIGKSGRGSVADSPGPPPPGTHRDFGDAKIRRNRMQRTRNQPAPGDSELRKQMAPNSWFAPRETRNSECTMN